MNRFSLGDKGAILTWGDMGGWCRQNFGEPETWENNYASPINLIDGYRWILGGQVINNEEDSFHWPCFWIPTNEDYAIFALRWL